MVNRFLLLTGFILFAILTNSIGYGHFSLSATQEIALLDYQSSDYQDGEQVTSGKSKAAINKSHALLVLLILCLLMASNRNASFVQRKIVLTPVFYQSNYVDQSLLNNQSTI